MPRGGKGRVDEVGGSGVYPVFAMEGASDDAVVQGEMPFGQGIRGAAGYEDTGSSEIFFLDEELKGAAENEGERGIPSQTVNPDAIEQAESGAASAIPTSPAASLIRTKQPMRLCSRTNTTPSFEM